MSTWSEHYAERRPRGKPVVAREIICDECRMRTADFYPDGFCKDCHELFIQRVTREEI